jgi:hypothetical protein
MNKTGRQITVQRLMLTIASLATVALLIAGCPSPGTGRTSHVYIAGYVGTSSTATVPVFWKDGALNYLPLTNGNTGGWTSGMLQDSSGNLYIVGGQWGGPSGNQIGYWKNLSFIPLSRGTYSVGGAYGIAVDTNGNVWANAELGVTTPDTFVFWRNSTGPNVFPGGATGVSFPIADKAGNVFFPGCTGTNPVLPCLWQNGAAPIQLALNGASSGYPEGMAMDGSGNLYAWGEQWSPTPPSSNRGAAYWRTVSGSWSSATLVPLGGHSATGVWTAATMAFDSLGNPSVAQEYGPQGSSSPTAIVYWKGLTDNPAEMFLPTGTSVVRLFGNAASFDASGNFLVAGTAGNNQPAGFDSTITDGVPLYWQNGNPISLPMGSGNTWGTAFNVVVGP